MKKFFDKKVIDWKFKKAGEGHSLSEESTPPRQQPSSKPANRAPPSSSSSQSAGSAALARIEAHERRGQPSRTPMGGGARGRSLGNTSPSTSGGRTVAETGGGVVRKTCSQPSQREDLAPVEPEVLDVASKNIMVHVFCPVCQQPVPNHESVSHLGSCLLMEASQEPLSGAVKMIHNLCRDQEKRKLCIDTILKYLSNIIAHPGEEKYCRIRTGNKAFQERVVGVAGSTHFLEAVGFQKQMLPHQDTEEEFLVLPREKAEAIADLETCKELLESGETLHFKLDRNLQVFKPSFRATSFDLPDSFFNMSVDEIRREQKSKSEAVVRDGVLRTKAMRERDEIKMAMRHYRFVLLRIRLPDGYIIQGIFRPSEKLRDVREFVAGALANQSHVFSLSYIGKPFSEDETTTIAAFGLAPAAVLNFSWDTSLGPTPSPPSLHTHLLARVQDAI